jgi:hypothetical protein
VQASLNLRMIEQAIVFPTGHKRKTSEIGEYRPVAILSIEPQQRAFLWKVVGRQIPTNRGDPFAQFFPIAPVPSVPETAEPLITVCLRHRCACPDTLPAFATSVARSTHVIQPAKGWRQVVSLG